MAGTDGAGSSAMVSLGYVSRPNGLRGAVVVASDPSMADVLARGLEVELIPRQGPAIRTTVRSSAPIRGGTRITFEGIDDRNAAEALVGATVTVHREQLGPFAEGEFLDTDLLDLEVVSRQGETLGRLVEVLATGANDVYVVRTADSGEILVPAVAHAVLDVDLEAGRMTVDAEALEYGAAPASASASASASKEDRDRGKTEER